MSVALLLKWSVVILWSGEETQFTVHEIKIACLTHVGQKHPQQYYCHT